MKSLKSFVQAIYRKFHHLILYGVIGASCASLDFLVYTILLTIDVPYLLANIVSVHFGIFSSFFLNRSFNFRVKDKTKRRFLSFYVVGLIGLCTSEALLYGMVLMGWNEVICKLITIVIVALVQFLLNKHITFRIAKNENTLV